MASRLIALRYAGRCSACSVEVPAKAKAWWDRDTKSIRCQSCGSADGIPTEAVPVPEPEPAQEPGTAPPRTTAPAGASALREYERRKAKREKQVMDRHPRLGRLILRVTDEPASTTAWAIGANGERRLGAALDRFTDEGIISLHDRRIPGSKANIDHLVVTPRGVWVVDAKRYSGQVSQRDVGGWLSTDLRLYVGRRDCTKLVKAMPRQVEAARRALDDPDVPIRAALCFIDAEWGLFARPFALSGVLIAWPKVLFKRLTEDGPLGRARIKELADRLDRTLEPA